MTFFRSLNSFPHPLIRSLTSTSPGVAQPPSTEPHQGPEVRVLVTQPDGVVLALNARTSEVERETTAADSTERIVLPGILAVRRASQPGYPELPLVGVLIDGSRTARDIAATVETLRANWSWSSTRVRRIP